jgi:gamma-glutamyltranspeptidase/glutathione hydrolase
MRTPFSISSKLAVAFCMLGALALTFIPDAPGQDRTQGRSMVISRNGIVATESPLAAQAGAQMLERGGNAVDAAIAANAVMGVVAPMSNGIGGDLFAIVYDAQSKKLYGLNASGYSPSGLTLDFVRSRFQDGRMPQRGVHSVTVPGAVDGWQKLLERFGKKTFAEVLAPAIRIAEDGFPVPEWVAALWAANVASLRPDPEAVKLYLPAGRAPAVGEVFQNAELARSMRLIAEGGRDAFYKGEIARLMLQSSRRYGGTLDEQDLAEFSSEWVEPISTTYRGWTVWELPPNGQGLAALEMLNIMETFPLGEWGLNSTRTLHAMIEAKKLAYADLIRYIGDPASSRLPVAQLLSKSFAAQRARQIDPNKASCSVSPGALPVGADTIYLSVVDREGNMVSLIQSIYSNFGSGLAAQGAGFVFHNRGGLFSLDPTSPNALAPRKRPLHTIIPAFMERGDQRIAFGIMGGWNQAQAHAQFVSHVADFGQNIQAAMEEARFTKTTFPGCDVDLEDRVPAGVAAELTSKGHVLDMHRGWSNTFGGGQAVMRDYAKGVNYGASDPRKDGAAIPELPGM